MNDVSQEFEYYKILGCHAQSTDEELRTAYYALAKVHHPDKGGDAQVFAALATAYRKVKTSGARASLAGLLRLLGHQCTACGGEGATRKQRGFTAVAWLPCTRCDGAGYQLVP